MRVYQRYLNSYLDSIPSEFRDSLEFRKKLIPVMEEPDEFAFLLMWARQNGWSVSCVYDSKDDVEGGSPLGFRIIDKEGVKYSFQDDHSSLDPSPTYVNPDALPDGRECFESLRKDYKKCAV